MVDAGFDVSRNENGEISMWWGTLVADRDASDASYNIPIVLSSIGEDGHILFDGKSDNHIDVKLYISQHKQNSGSRGGSGCNVGVAGLFGTAMICCMAVWKNMPKKQK
jgi:hypothetical protein